MPYYNNPPTFNYNPAPLPQYPQPNNNSFVWVQGEAAAKAYPVAPNNRVMLMDSESPVLYIKSADSSGRPSTWQIFDLVERTTTSEATETDGQNGSSFSVKDEIDAYVAEAVKKEMERYRNKRRPPKNNKEVNSDA